MRRIAAVGVLVACLAVAVAEGGQVPRKLEPGESLLTIYTHIGVVRQCRTIPLQKGVSEYRFTDVAAMLEPTTVRFEDQTDPAGTRVLEQNFLHDLVSEDALLERFVDRQIEFVDSRGKSHRGKLLAYEETSTLGLAGENVDTLSITLQAKDGSVEVIRHSSATPHLIRFPELPKNYLTRPTLVWQVRAARPGDHDVVVSYITEDISWRSTYTAVLNPKETHLDLHGWVTIDNECGARFANARIKLVAGDVRWLGGAGYGGFGGEELGEDFDEEVEEKAFFEYHLYTLPRATTLENNQTKQIEFINVEAVPVRKTYIYDAMGMVEDLQGEYLDEQFGVEAKGKVRIHVEFTNSKESNLGIPLPAGILRFHKRDEADGALEFLGEDVIDHTPRDEAVSFYVGNAFDIVGERTRKDYTLPKDNQIRETYAIEVRNHKDEAVTVRVQEPLFRGINWTIEKSSRPFTKLGARRIEFALPVPANGKADLAYTVLYSWPRPVLRIQQIEADRKKEGDERPF